ncbi:glycosyltransferase [Algoriphagus aquatilis]|uniref:Glycosyltransferase n=1 Tax=Algoriphagus aquatilis TaxID=490186 RepID=A0ABW0BVT6_9BACT
MKIIAIPIDKNWFQGGNHYFLSLVYALERFQHPQLKYFICTPSDLNKFTYDGILSIRCHLFTNTNLLNSRSVPLFLYHDDFHYFKFRTFFNSKDFESIVDKVDILFSTYALNMLSQNIFKKFSSKTHWTPLSVSNELFTMYNFDEYENRFSKILFSGMVSYMYPLREKIMRSYSLNNLEKVEILDHGGYSPNKSGLFSSNYYNHLSQFKGAIVTSAIKPTNFAVMKYFEIPACGCLPFLEDTLELKYLGFQDGLNCVIINKNNFDKKFKILDSPIAKIIAKEARSLIKNNHTHDSRIEYMSNIILSYFK